MTRFLSIDFEDIAHDFKRDLKLWETGPLRIDALWKSYSEIDQFFRENGRDKDTRGTFFCTGIIAEQAPDLIQKIASDGHEVACHYHFHDEMVRQTPSEVETMLVRAKHVLEDASGTKVSGFRAPKFKINKTDPDQYASVQRHFDYDSSFPANTLEDVREFKRKMGLDRLKILPIFSGKSYGVTMKMGGSYLKMFPKFMSDKLIDDAETAGFIPHIYLHPHEFSSRGEFKLNGAERQPLGWKSSTYWALRQTQWHSVGNKTLPAKLRKLVSGQGLEGRLVDHLDTLAI